ncbi:MAG: extracellular solute-binding protein [Candidatus Paceibacterota bacterium]|jgi:multiple sugar transport system substrate-binding protein
MTKPQLFFLGGIAFIIIFFVLLFSGIIPGLQTKQPEAVKADLSMWGVDSSDALTNVFATFAIKYPGVRINYKQFKTREEYDSSLLEAFASSKSPDIFMISDRDFPRFVNKISPFPSEIFSLLQLKNLFPQIVEQTFTQKGVVYALPFSIDSLALVYNKDIFNTAGIATPPETWELFKDIIPSLTKKDKTGTILQAGAALGGSEKSVRNAADILSALMIQSGTKMVDAGFTRAALASNEGINALGFYTQFADTGKETYTWNNSLPYSIDFFSQGKVAMMFGYLSDIKEIESRNAFLNFGIAPMPQPKEAAKAVSYPSYAGYAVSRQSQKKSIAWDFIVTSATDPVTAKTYSDVLQIPPALNALIRDALGDVRMSVFARQALTAKSWPQINASEITRIFSNLIETVTTKKALPKDALPQAESQVNELFTKSAL